MANLENKVDRLVEEMAKANTHLMYVRNTLEGNGREGLVSKVDKLEKKDARKDGMMKVVVGVGIFLGSTQIIEIVRGILK